MTNAVKEIPIPERMQHLARDPRGYPVPFIVMTDKQGGAHFAINDERIVGRAAREQLCSICGQSLPEFRWFIGGVRNAFHRRGAYIDGPMHEECAHYALKVCPYLAMPSYRGVNLDKAVERAAAATGLDVFFDRTQSDGKPPVFVAVLARSKRSIISATSVVFFPKRPYRKVEYWRNGVQMAWREGRTIRDAVMAGDIAPAS